VAHLAVEEPQHLFGRQIEQGVRAQRAADASHHHRGPQPVARDIADDDPQIAGGRGEHVVPIAADHQSLSRYIACSQLETAALRQRHRQQAAFEHTGDRPLDDEVAGLDRSGDPIGNDLEQVNVFRAERTVFQPSDMQHSERLLGTQERDPEHYANSLLPENRIRHGGWVDARENQW
jgi:hypothetical protein